MVAAYADHTEAEENVGTKLDTEKYLKYYFFIRQGVEADSKSLAPIDSRMVTGIVNKLSKEFQNSPFLSNFKDEILNVSLKLKFISK